MIPVKEITVYRTEGPICYCGKKQTYTSLRDADRALACLEYTYPKLGYDKHDVVVVWADGRCMEFRVDAKHPTNQYYFRSGNTVSGTIQLKASYYLDPKIKLNDMEKGNVEFFKDLTANYEI